MSSTAPSSHLARAVPYVCGLSAWQHKVRVLFVAFVKTIVILSSNNLRDLTRHLTARTDDGHAAILSVSGKPIRLTFILLSPLVRFLVLNRIKPQLLVLVAIFSPNLQYKKILESDQNLRASFSKVL